MQELKENRAIDLFVTYRFLKLLTTPFDKQDAFKRGIIDKNGKVLKKARSLTAGADKKAYTLLHRLVFNFKRILKTVGLGSKFGTYAAAAVALLKETYGQSNVYEKEIYRYLKNEGYKFDPISESNIVNEPISSGSYKVINDLYDIEGDIVVPSGSMINIKEDIEVFDTILGYEVYPVEVKGTSLYITSEDIKHEN
tara:strand:- start:309 stop:896 length:588 start_codon:yes stop_codon:yes gene_type:complete